ncbi:MAG: hypothetical protein U9N33_08195 [Campylobacterota bacterium]|nr:hypothetical protein [Campylobacterota bacterium]
MTICDYIGCVTTNNSDIMVKVNKDAKKLLQSKDIDYDDLCVFHAEQLINDFDLEIDDNFLKIKAIK